MTLSYWRGLSLDLELLGKDVGVLGQRNWVPRGATHWNRSYGGGNVFLSATHNMLVSDDTPTSFQSCQHTFWTLGQLISSKLKNFLLNPCFGYLDRHDLLWTSQSSFVHPSASNCQVLP